MPVGGRARAPEDIAIRVVAALGVVEAIAGLVAGRAGLAIVGSADVVVCTLAELASRP